MTTFTTHKQKVERLILVPNALNSLVPDIQLVRDYLQTSQFIGQSWNNDLEGSSFLAGEAFLQLITFMGCSPHIELAPPADGRPFCYIRIAGPWSTPQLYYGHNTKIPLCHNCRQRIAAWREALATWIAHPEAMSIECSQCGHKQSPVAVNWRREAGFGRLFVIIENVFPGEAAPVPGFLKGLQQATAIPWHYFYMWQK